MCIYLYGYLYSLFGVTVVAGTRGDVQTLCNKLYVS
jgi:hypothetical protein